MLVAEWGGSEYACSSLVITSGMVALCGLNPYIGPVGNGGLSAWRLERAEQGGRLMATVEHFGPYQYDLDSGGLGPQQSYWISFGPDDRFKDATVIITPHPSPDVAGTTSSVASNVLSQRISVWLTHTHDSYIRFRRRGFTQPLIHAWLVWVNVTAIRCQWEISL